MKKMDKNQYLGYSERRINKFSCQKQNFTHYSRVFHNSKLSNENIRIIEANFTPTRQRDYGRHNRSFKRFRSNFANLRIQNNQLSGGSFACAEPNNFFQV